MKKKKIIQLLLVAFVLGVLITAGLVLYMFNMPHRDVQKAKTDFVLSVTELVAEYLENPEKSNEKYLDEVGESKILAVTGMVHSIYMDLNNQVVIVLKDSIQKAGVSCTFMAATNSNAERVLEGEVITVKGVIRSGAGYDPDLDLYEDVIMEKCNVIKS